MLIILVVVLLCGLMDILQLPILAAWNGHTEVVKILAPLTDNPNAPNDIGRTPNQWGITPLAVAKNTEIREILKTYIK